MRFDRVIACLLLLIAGPAWAASDIRELTRDNVHSQSFEFKFERTDYWFCAVVKVTVRPRNEDLYQILDRLGGCLGRCQESANSFSVEETAMHAKKENGTLVYVLRVPKWSPKRCFYFWWLPGGNMPAQDIWWVSIDSPLARGEAAPK
jgi:hypothetical protein